MIGLITYDIPHRKTQDLLAQLLFRGEKDIHLLAIPFVKRSKIFTPVFAHRPGFCAPVGPEDLANNLRLNCTKTSIDSISQCIKELDCKHVMIAGAGLLPQDLVQNYQIINGHPGHLPFVKGLDALKWALLEEKPLGVTTHYISPKADEGKLISCSEVPLYRNDDFYALAMRMYEMEISMLANAPSILESGEAPLTDLSSDEDAHRRMPNRLEPEMMAAFERRRQNAPMR